MLMDRRARELAVISLLAAFCAGLAWDHDQKLFAAAFARRKIRRIGGAFRICVCAEICEIEDC
jgi:hypothetical protein